MEKGTWWEPATFDQLPKLEIRSASSRSPPLGRDSAWPSSLVKDSSQAAAPAAGPPGRRAAAMGPLPAVEEAEQDRALEGPPPELPRDALEGRHGAGGRVGARALAEGVEVRTKDNRTGPPAPQDPDEVAARDRPDGVFMLDEAKPGPDDPRAQVILERVLTGRVARGPATDLVAPEHHAVPQRVRGRIQVRRIDGRRRPRALHRLQADGVRDPGAGHRDERDRRDEGCDAAPRWAVHGSSPPARPALGGDWRSTPHRRREPALHARERSPLCAVGFGRRLASLRSPHGLRGPAGAQGEVDHSPQIVEHGRTRLPQCLTFGPEGPVRAR